MFPLKTYRAKRKISQDALAAEVEAAGQRLFGPEYTCEQAQISRWERGAHLPAPHHMLALLVATRGSITERPGHLSLEALVRSVPLPFSALRKSGA
jgi:transcriptional regulator with XRE-family HTH domain